MFECLVHSLWSSLGKETMTLLGEDCHVGVSLRFQKSSAIPSALSDSCLWGGMWSLSYCQGHACLLAAMLSDLKVMDCYLSGTRSLN